MDDLVAGLFDGNDHPHKHQMLKNLYHGLDTDGTERNFLDGGVDNTVLPTLCLLFYSIVIPCDLIQPIQSTCQHLCKGTGGVCG